MEVKLLNMPQDALSILYAAYKQCYSADAVTDSWQTMRDTKDDTKAKFVANVIQSGHMSPLEHVSFTFAISGISRTCSHQLVRHRLASYSQQSQRYVDSAHFQYVIPPEIADESTKQEAFCRAMEAAANAYKALRDQGVKEEDARFILPQAISTCLVVTMNCRELLHFFELRCCQRAQWEIRNLAKELLKLCKEALPAVFSNAGAKCERLKYCPEGKFSCGKYTTEDHVIQAIRQHSGGLGKLP